MPIGGKGASLLSLMMVFLFGNLCFHFIEAVPRRIKTRFARYQKAAARHPPPETRRIKNV